MRRVFSDHPDLDFRYPLRRPRHSPRLRSEALRLLQNNVSDSLDLFRASPSVAAGTSVFSSSASVYEAADGSMVTEESPVRPQSPYARTKLMTEMALEDMAAAYGLKAVALRYFNPIGADPQDALRQAQREVTQIVGILVEVANGERPLFSVTGTDWPTRDGTGIRDYFHVWDLARAHVKAVERMNDIFPQGARIRDNQPRNRRRRHRPRNRRRLRAHPRLPHTPTGRPSAPGDVAGAYTNADKAERLLNWRAQMPLEEALSHALAWRRAMSVR